MYFFEHEAVQFAWRHLWSSQFYLDSQILDQSHFKIDNVDGQTIGRQLRGVQTSLKFLPLENCDVIVTQTTEKSGDRNGSWTTSEQSNLLSEKVETFGWSCFRFKCKQDPCAWGSQDEKLICSIFIYWTAIDQVLSASCNMTCLGSLSSPRVSAVLKSIKCASMHHDSFYSLNLFQLWWTSH